MYTVKWSEVVRASHILDDGPACIRCFCRLYIYIYIGVHNLTRLTWFSTVFHLSCFAVQHVFQAKCISFLHALYLSVLQDSFFPMFKFNFSLNSTYLFISFLILYLVCLFTWKLSVSCSLFCRCSVTARGTLILCCILRRYNSWREEVLLQTCLCACVGRSVFACTYRIAGMIQLLRNMCIIIRVEQFCEWWVNKYSCFKVSIMFDTNY